MDALEALRDATTRMIAENPLQVAIHRVEYADDGAGGRSPSQETDLPAFTGRLVPSRRQSDRSFQNEAGLRQESKWLLMTPWDADIKSGTSVTDTFTAKGILYKVTKVIPREYRGELFAIHAEVEEVK